MNKKNIVYFSKYYLRVMCDVPINYGHDLVNLNSGPRKTNIL